MEWYIFAILAVVTGISNGVFAYQILSYLSKHNIKVNYWMIRLYMLKYLAQYRKVTIGESGQPGNLYYAWIISIGLFVFSAIALIILVNK